MNKFNIGEKVAATLVSTVKEGSTGIVEGFYQEGGFWKYQVNWDHGSSTVAREKDLRPCK